VLSVDQQIERGALVCPTTGERLVERNGRLTTPDGRHSYRIEGGVPILLPTRDLADEKPDRPVEAAPGVAPRRLTKLQTAVDRLFNSAGDQRSEASLSAWRAFISHVGENDLCVSVGGGPSRPHPFFVNLNIEAADHVEVVADAHRLPYADRSVDAIHCEAVLEHLEEPQAAVREMYRVLRPGGEVYSVTPFLQGYHGYPNHFFNPTLEGHRGYFSRLGFEIDSCGVCVGPSWMISSLIPEYVSMLVPVRGLRAIAVIATRALLLPVRFLDRAVNRSDRAHVLASTTYVHARKPA
jgi:uncharacterized protein YbaR (Trm112 family)